MFQAQILLSCIYAGMGVLPLVYGYLCHSAGG